jgi:hypothetical protein
LVALALHPWPPGNQRANLVNTLNVHVYRLRELLRTVDAPEDLE